ncbi:MULTISPECIES: hypothetical protein [unclassified Corynebacterium]|uniref:hypothetical protein n=1 Tax=unclassified Corynebacterium TaxID=2624378 RepID=UPI00309EDA1D
MEPFDLNSGRFYLRQLRHDDRVDDAPVLSNIYGREISDEYFAQAEQDWSDGTVFRWALSEQTNIELVAEVVVTRNADGTTDIAITPNGDLDRVLPGDDDTLVPVTVGDAVETARGTVSRWVADEFAG